MTNKSKILVVDDEELLREAIVFQFKREGFEVLSASNGKDALHIIQNESVDAVISDIQMPGGNGIELLKNIKNFNSELPVLVFITAFADLTEQDAYDLGANAIFTKPFDRKQLVKCIHESIKYKGRNWKKDDVLPEVSKMIECHEPVSVGRGGAIIEINSEDYKQGEEVGLMIPAKCGDDVIVLKGQGKVRWVRRASAECPSAIGVEFLKIENESLEPYDKWLDQNSIKPFIPKN